MRRGFLCLFFCLAIAVTGGCGGSDDSTPKVADSPAGAAIEGGSDEERKEAREVQDYFVRNCALPGTIRRVSKRERELPLFPIYKRWLTGEEAMCGHMASIAVDGTRVTIRSEIAPGTRKAAGEAFCNLIQGSDVADFTPGHELQDLDGETIKVCPARND